MPPRKAPRVRCRLAQDCSLCPARVKPGQWMSLVFETGEWVHYDCMKRKAQQA